MDDLLKRIPSEGTATGQAGFALIFTSRCSATRRDEIARYVTKTFAKMNGGARVVQQAVELMDQCIARRALIEPEIRAWLGTPAARLGGPPKHSASVALFFRHVIVRR